jgi:hypothetical protein
VYEGNSYRSGLFVVSTEKGSRPINLGNAGPPHWDDINQWWGEDPQWSADSRLIYYRIKNGETWQVWRSSREGGSPIQVTHLERNVQSVQLSADDARLILAVEKPSTSEQQFSEHGILYDGTIEAGPPKPFLDQVAEAGGVKTETWLHDLKDGTERKATEEESQEYTPPWEPVRSGKLFSAKEVELELITGPKISPDQKSVVYQRSVTDPSQAAQYSTALFVKPTPRGVSHTITPLTTYVDQYWWSADSKEIYYTQYDVANPSDPRPSKVTAVASAG